ncbi:hypothetical protein HNR37_000760 [Desulfurispira natronophila]|uniref:Uncharacterized protein n=1 Tax=Desulfurispira natronophila TaxID=682562 RepID=A0A7W8DGF8_9BACT|nr:hypothetical protein [Desulfurispira natronophila]
MVYIVHNRSAIVDGNLKRAHNYLGVLRANLHILLAAVNLKVVHSSPVYCFYYLQYTLF